jgi:acyl dehydratase
MAEPISPVTSEQVISQGRTVTEADIRTWAGLVHDYTALHVDAEVMGHSFFGRPVAHGYIALNLAIGLMFPGLADWYAPGRAQLSIGWTDVRFLAPVYAGDTLRCRRTVRSAAADRVDHLVEVLNQDDTVVVSGVEHLMVPPGEPERRARTSPSA